MSTNPLDKKGVIFIPKMDGTTRQGNYNGGSRNRKKGKRAKKYGQLKILIVFGDAGDLNGDPTMI